MKKFIPILVLVAGLFSAVSCRQADDLADGTMPSSNNVIAMKNSGSMKSVSAKGNDSVSVNQPTNGLETDSKPKDPPVKDGIKW